MVCMVRDEDVNKSLFLGIKKVHSLEVGVGHPIARKFSRVGFKFWVLVFDK